MMQNSIFAVLAVALMLTACGSQADDGQDTIADVLDDGMEVADATPMDVEEEDAGPTPAPDFALTDLNPGSPSYEEERRISDETGKVLVIYFANYT